MKKKRSFKIATRAEEPIRRAAIADEDSRNVISPNVAKRSRVFNLNPCVLLKASGEVAKARGMAEVAKTSRFGRESLYKTLAPGAKPRFETIAIICGR